MTRLELDKWIENHEMVDYEQDYDACGNHEVSRIYKDLNGKLFRIEFLNESPYEEWDKSKGGWIRGEYSPPVEVIKKTYSANYYEEI